MIHGSIRALNAQLLLCKLQLDDLLEKFGPQMDEQTSREVQQTAQESWLSIQATNEELKREMESADRSKV